MGLLKPGDLQDEDVKAERLIFARIIWLPLTIHTPGGFVSECIAYLFTYFFSAANTGPLKMQSQHYCFVCLLFFLTKILKGEC